MSEAFATENGVTPAPGQALARRKAPLGSELPVLMTPAAPGESLLDAFTHLRGAIEEAVSTVGGVLLRGFDVPSTAMFQAFAQAFGQPLLNYDFASTPRTAMGGGVYTSTEYPAHQHIPLHNEQAYTREWPLRIWFHCVIASQTAGETPLADSRGVYRHLSGQLREQFKAGILYVRNYGDFDVPWQQVFNTDSKQAVESYCRRAGIEWQWSDDGGLRTRQLCQAIEHHPHSGEALWFNQAHLFHISSQMAEIRETLEELLGVENLPRNVYYADGSPIPDAVFDEIRAVLAEQEVIFSWQAGDVLMLDNMLVAHGRSPYRGPRQVVVAMAGPHGNLDAYTGGQ